ncbi:hypothetical protein KOI35_25825 [Actinoplanes bogorensis]|uniref:DUF222 domain-containing protein n=1 Tax=Paractinoplanes bogorensis TaxID=1610840 RepID=A0ABS5YV36_9ACTN|nr:hypothetical protein [Actinoplanes bogorensis]MBU2666936.1 hypothetical protein [Actinoplanes bogorensis]
MDDSLLDAVRMARSHLADLVADGESADRLDDRLAGLLRRAAAGTDVTTELENALASEAIVRAWVADVRRDPELWPPDLRPGRRGAAYTALPGEPGPIGAPRYGCPHPDRDYYWFRRHVAQPIPECPTHRLRLVRG